MVVWTFVLATAGEVFEIIIIPLATGNKICTMQPYTTIRSTGLVDLILTVPRVILWLAITGINGRIIATLIKPRENAAMTNLADRVLAERERRTKQLTRALAVVAVSFLLFTLPSFVLKVLIYFGYLIESVIIDIVAVAVQVWICGSNAIVFFVTGKQYRSQAFNFLRACCSKCNHTNP